MFTNKIYIQAVMLLVVALFIASCGGSSNVGALATGQIDDSRVTTGVTLGDFEVLRYNADGAPDPLMNSTIELSLRGDSLVISVEDGGVNGVALDVNYDNAAVHPGAVEFRGLLGSDEEVLSASFTRNTGLVGIASAPIGGMDLGSFNGEYATIAFPAGAVRGISAVGDVHHGTVGATGEGAVNLFGEGDPLASTASVSWTTAFHTGDGDQNSETGLSDLTVIALFFGKNTNADWSAAVADYDENTEVGMSDITKIAIFFGEATAGFVVSFADNDGAGKTEYSGGPVDWTPSLDPIGAPLFGNFKTAFNWWSIDITAGSAFSYADLGAFDLNADGFVNCYVANAIYSGTPPVVSQMGNESVVEVPVGAAEPEPAVVNILGYEIAVAGEAIAADTIMTGDAAATLVANGQVEFTLFNVFGRFDGEDFDKDTLPTAGIGDEAKTMTQQNYDDIFDACLVVLDWQFNDTGHADIRRTTSWSTHTSGSGGDPGLGTVFPDDDPQSDAASPEGLLVTALPVGSPLGNPGIYPDNDEIAVSYLGGLPYNFEFDIDLDALASVLSDFNLTELELVVPNELLTSITFGTNGVPADLEASTAFQLVPIQENGWAYDPVDRNWIDFTYNEGELGSNEYVIFAIDGAGQVFAQVNGSSLQSDTIYSPRIMVDGVWSSINKPDPTVGVREFQAPEVVVLPEVCGPAVTELQLFPSDPKVRRNGEMSFDLLLGNPVFADEDAFDDVLKIDLDADSEFPIEFNAPTLETFPIIVVVPGGSPSVIEGPNDPNRMPSANILTRQGNKLYVDIAAVPRPTGPSDPNTPYAFRLFTRDGTVFGEGTFECIYLPLSFEDPIAVDWAVNLWDRAEGNVTDLLDPGFYDSKALLDGTTVGSLTPDVLWFEFSGGWVFEGLIFNPMRIIADEVPPGDFAPINLRIEIAGLTNDDHYLGFHTVVLDDFFSITNPSGLFRNGGIYEFTPFDEQAASSSASYETLMTVSGSPF